MSHYRRRSLGVEEGAVAVTASILLSMLILLTAVVVDLGLLRMDERESQLAADMAASAALLPVDEFDPFAPGAAHNACENAWEYIVANVEGINAAAAVEDPSGLPPCSAFGAAVVCNGASPNPVTSRIVAPPYTIEITSPVLDVGDGHAISDELMRQNDGLSGGPCERVGVRVERDRAYILAGIAGFGSGSSRPSAVSMWRPGERDDFASLIVLEQHDCYAMRVQGGGASAIGIEVTNYDPGTPGDPSDDIAGEITVDSDATGSCGASQPYAIEVGGVTKGYVYGEGSIGSKAMEVGNTGSAYEGTDLTTPQTDSPAGVKLAVPPTPDARELRSPVDHPLNCLTNAEYYSGQPWSPQHGTEQVPDCTGEDQTYILPGPVTVDRPPFVQRMHDRLQPVTAASAGWTVYPDHFPGQACDNADQAIDAAETTTDDGTPLTTGQPVGEYLYINCGTGGALKSFTPDPVTVSGVKVIVSRQLIRLTSSQSFVVDGHDSSGSILFLQNGSLEKVASAQMNLTDTFTYLSSLSTAYVDIGAQATPPLVWRGPLTDPSTRSALQAACDTYVQTYPAATTPPSTKEAVPPAGCFGPATLWSNGTQDHSIGGQAQLNIAGTFFTPNAKFDFDGNGNQILDEAQFFARKLWLSGQARVELVPNPDTNFETSSPTSGLIR